ncbi:protein kinase [Candidatus Woesearchaeota archaeon]|nr:protein kinase [Candidatus Woesearchaeota archaeon]
MERLELLRYLDQDFKIMDVTRGGGSAHIVKATALRELSQFSLKKGVTVALKSPKNPNAEARQRFKIEYEVLNRFKNHPHIVTPYGLTQCGERYPILVMEWVERSLASYTRDQNAHFLTPDIAGKFLKQAGAALSALHDQNDSVGYLHRDIKPDNLLLLGNNQTVKLSDFGCVMPLGSAPERELLPASSSHGLVYYGAPETLEDDETKRVYSRESDIYSLAVSMIYLLAGTTPFEGDAAGTKRKELVVRKRDSTYLDDAVAFLLSERIPKHQQEVLRQAIDGTPGNRQPSVQAFLDDFFREKKDPHGLYFAERYKTIEEVLGDPARNVFGVTQEIGVDRMLTAYEEMVKYASEHTVTSSLVGDAKTKITTRAQQDYRILEGHIAGASALENAAKKHPGGYTNFGQELVHYFRVWGDEFSPFANPQQKRIHATDVLDFSDPRYKEFTFDPRK